MNKQILKGIIFVGLFAVPFIPFLVSGSLFFPFITTKAFAWRIIVEVVFAAWVILALLEPQYRPRKSFILYAVGAFLAVIGLADIFGEAPGKSFWSNYERMEGFISLLHLGMFFLVSSSVLREIEWKRWWNTTLVASFLMVCYSFFQLAGVLEIHQGGVRVDGTLGNASYLAVYMLIHIFIALYFLVRERNRVYKWLYGILVLLQIIILYNTATRGAILGLLGGLLITAVLSVRNRENKLLRKVSIAYVVFLVLVAGSFFALRNSQFVEESQVLARFADISTEELKSGGRSFIWPMAIEGIKERPLLGWGQDNFNYVFNKHYSPQMYHLEQWFDRAHNIFLDWGIAGGILGLMAYLALYGVLLFYIWSRNGIFSSSDRAILTGLLAAYFFHNLFVFDHLISYILFFSLLSYVHVRVTPHSPEGKGMSQEKIYIVSASVAILLGFGLYFGNIRPIIGNASLIDALQGLQTSNFSQAAGSFQKSYGQSKLGRSEAVEQMVTHVPAVLSGLSTTEEKNHFFNFIKGALLSQLEDFPDDARHQLTAGNFFLITGFFDEALVHLEIAESLSPGKQQIKFRVAEAHIQKGDFGKALATLKEAYEMNTSYTEAQFAYAMGAIYAGDRVLEESLKDVIYAGDRELEAELKKAGIEGEEIERWATDDRIITAYLRVGRYSDIVELLKRRIERDPMVAQSYVSLASAYLELGERGKAIETLRTLATLFPQYRAQAEDYIQDIREGRNP